MLLGLDEEIPIGFIELVNSTSRVAPVINMHAYQTWSREDLSEQKNWVQAIKSEFLPSSNAKHLKY